MKCYSEVVISIFDELDKRLYLNTVGFSPIKYSRLNKVGVSLSYTSVLSKMSEIGVDHDATVIQWGDSLKKAEVNLNKETKCQLVSPMEISIVKTTEGYFILWILIILSIYLSIFLCTQLKRKK